MKMTPKQARFVCEYVKCKSGVEAAIKAGYSPKTARIQAAQVLAKLSIRNEIRDKQNAVAMRALLQVEDVIREAMIVAFSSLEDYLDFNGIDIVEKPACLMDKVKLKALQSIKIKTRTTTATNGDVTVEREAEYKLWPKMDAIDKLAKHFGMFLDQDELKRLQDKADEIRIKLNAQHRPQLTNGHANGNGKPSEN